jgi:hypothetical protein
VQRVLPSFFDELRAIWEGLLAYFGALVALSMLVAQTLKSTATIAGLEPPARPQWIEIARPYPAFALALPELNGAEFRYAIHRHAAGGGRRDTMSWGGLDRPVSHFALEIYRPGTEIDGLAAPQNEIAARAADLGLISSITPLPPIDSKFGAVASAAIALAHNDETRHCLGFALPVAGPRLQIAGVYCKPAAELVDRATLACALDRLSLISAGSDAKTAEFFARAELKRNFCGQRSPLLHATPRRGDWTAGGPEAKLRGRVAER